jgi:hypothetical protein
MPTLRLLPDFEDAIKQIPGVRAASVVTTADAVPTEVHVLASPTKPAKQVVRDVQSLAMTQYDLEIDHRIVSVVQIGEDDSSTSAPVSRGPAAATGPVPVETTSIAPDPVMDSSPPSEPAGTNGAVRDELAVSVSRDALSEGALDDGAPRARIAAIMVRTAGTEAEATVTVSAGGQVFEGKAVGPGAPTHRPRLVAQATLNAVSELLGTHAEVDAVTVVTAGPRDVALTVLSVMIPRIGEQPLCGSAVVRGDEAEAVARSVLAALNRRLTG